MITIKVPDERVNKFRLQIRGSASRRFLRASSLLNALDKVLSRKEFEKKLAIIVKYSKGTTNETLASNDRNYLLYTTACFLEDYLEKSFLRNFTKNL